MQPLPAEFLTVAHHLDARSVSGASIASLRLSTSATAKATNERSWNVPVRTRAVRASLKGWEKWLSKPQRQSGPLAADVLAIIWLQTFLALEKGTLIEKTVQIPQPAYTGAINYGKGLRYTRCKATLLPWPLCPPRPVHSCKPGSDCGFGKCRTQPRLPFARWGTC